MRVALRYLFYLAFVVLAAAFWMLIAVLVLGLSMGDPVCVAEGTPCPEPGPLEYAGHLLIIFGAIPATALSFVFYRRAVRGMFGLAPEGQAASSNQ